jgi:hypothetical protein
MDDVANWLEQLGELPVDHPARSELAVVDRTASGSKPRVQEGRRASVMPATGPVGNDLFWHVFHLDRIYDPASFDDLVGGDQQLRRYNRTKRFGRLEIDCNQIFSSPSDVDHRVLVARRSQIN